MNSNFWQALIVIIGLILWSYGLSGLFRQVPSLLPQNGTTQRRFLLALFAPLAMGVSGYITVPLSKLVSPAVAFLVFPLTLSVWTFVNDLRRMALARTSISNWSRYEWLCFLCIGSLLLTILLALATNALRPMHAHDVLVYLNEAKAFAINKSLSSIPSFASEGPLDRVIPGHPHDFIYQAQLASGLILGDSKIGFPNDLGARILIQSNIFYLLLGFVLVAFLWSHSLALTAFGLAVLSFEDLLSHSTLESSRDAFRILPLILTLLLSREQLLNTIEGRKVSLANSILLFILNYWTLAAHTLNSALLGIFLFGLLFVLLAKKIPPRRLFYFLLPFFAGYLLASIHYLKMYLLSGKALGFGFDYYAYKGTTMWEAFVAKRSALDQRGFLTKFVEFAANQKLLLLFAASLLATVPWLIRLKLKALNAYVYAIAIFIILNLGISTGLFDYSSDVRLSSMLTSNPRYVIHWPYLWTLLSLPIIRLVLQNFGIGNRFRRYLAPIALIIVASFSLQLFHAKWQRENRKSFYDSDFYTEIAYLNHSNTTGLSLSFDRRYLYYLKSPAGALFSFPFYDVVQSSDPSQILSKLREKKITRIIFKSDKVENWVDHLPLFQVLNQDPSYLGLDAPKGLVVFNL